MDTSLLESYHEEADSRIILQCLQANAPNIVVAARDPDVLVLLFANFGRMSCLKLWMKAGTMKNLKYVPVHDIRKELDLTLKSMRYYLHFTFLLDATLCPFSQDIQRKQSEKSSLKTTIFSKILASIQYPQNRLQKMLKS